MTPGVHNVQVGRLLVFIYLLVKDSVIPTSYGWLNDTCLHNVQVVVVNWCYGLRTAGQVIVRLEFIHSGLLGGLLWYLGTLHVSRGGVSYGIYSDYKTSQQRSVELRADLVPPA